MVKDLESGGKLIGLSRAEVLTLLGPPDRDDNRYSVTYTVDIGHKFASEPWPYSLVISFNKASERVEEVVLRD